MGSMTEEKRKRIAEMWNLGLPSSVIAEDVGLTRNSVIGAVYRLRQKGEILIKAEDKRTHVFRPKKPLAIRKNIPKPPVLGKPVGIMKLTPQSCRYIVSDEGVEETLYCNKPIDKESYCAEHYKLCYVPHRRSIEQV
jgi:hypothetical protein